MAVRIRQNGRILCAAAHPALTGDTYLHDGLHYKLAVELGVLVSEPMDPDPANPGRGGHAQHGEWWWRDEVPDDVVLEKLGARDAAGSKRQPLCDRCHRPNFAGRPLKKVGLDVRVCIDCFCFISGIDERDPVTDPTARSGSGHYVSLAGDGAGSTPDTPSAASGESSAGYSDAPAIPCPRPPSIPCEPGAASPDQTSAGSGVGNREGGPGFSLRPTANRHLRTPPRQVAISGDARSTSDAASGAGPHDHDNHQGDRR